MILKTSFRTNWKKAVNKTKEKRLEESTVTTAAIEKTPKHFPVSKIVLAGTQKSFEKTLNVIEKQEHRTNFSIYVRY